MGRWFSLNSKSESHLLAASQAENHQPSWDTEGRRTMVLLITDLILNGLQCHLPSGYD